MRRTELLATGLALMLATASWAAGGRPAATPYPGEPSVGEPTQMNWEWLLRLGSGTGIQAAADFVIGKQCDDGGWGWPLDCPPTYHNITAPIAIGLLRAYDFSGDVDSLLAAIKGGDYDLTGVFDDSGDTAFGSLTPAFFYILSDVTGDSTYSDNAAEDFFDKLTAGTYGDPAVDPTYYPADTYKYLTRHKVKRSGYLVNLRPWDMQYMPWVAGLIGNADSTTPPDSISQQDTFLQAVLDGLNTLDDTDPDNVPWDLIGLAGGVRGLAMNGTTSFPAIVAPNHAINGIDNLCDLADALAAYQNANGSWYWSSNISSPVSSDEDTQNTAYAVMALIAAQEAGCGPYDTEIELGREWLRSMQDSADGGFFSYPGGDKNIEVCGEVISAETPVTEIALDSETCNAPGGTLTVEINVAVETGQYVRGGQFFMEYDNAVLTFVSADPNASFPQEFEDVNPAAGTIDYSVGVAQGQGGVLEPTNMATLTFTIVGGSDLCETADLVEFRPHVPPSRLADGEGEPILLTSSDLEPVMIDGSPPHTLLCPADVDINADAGTCEALVDPGWASADDTCDPDPLIEYKRSDYANWNEGLGDPYPAGTTTITWRATDHCDNYVECDQDVDVSSFNELVVDVQLSPTMVTGPFTRCITFELWDCGTNSYVTVQKTIEFTDGLGSAVLDDVPCGVYDCITARDTLHTLRSTDDDDFGIVGTQYVADFTVGDQLVGGNLNDDQWIDILDYAIFTWQYGTFPPASTDCSTPYPHADINGNGHVYTEDFTFIQVNYLLEHEANCCGMPGFLLGGPVPVVQSAGPVTRISVDELKRRGLGHLAVGDLNGDGWLDEIDIVLFIQGLRP